MNLAIALKGIMATRVLPVDHSSMDGDCETSGTELASHSTGT